jgi:hypothetical protein
MTENEQTNPSTKPETIFDEAEFINTDYDKHIRQARNTIFVVAAIQFVFGIVSSLRISDEYTKWVSIGFAFFVAFTFLLLALWTKKKPYLAILIALLFYCSLLLIDFVLNPRSILSGIIVKVIVIIYLAKGLRDAREAQHIKDSMGLK